MRAYFLSSVAVALLLSACSGLEEPGEVDGVEKTASALRGTGTATITVTQDWGTGYCANVNVKNTGSTTTNTWQVNVSLYSATFTNGWSSTMAQNRSTLVIRNAADNGAIAPNATANPTPGFCANRPAGTPLPTVQTVIMNYCGMGYRDKDGDGFGTGSAIYTCEYAGYATKAGDCCDSDLWTYPGSTVYGDVANGCGSFDYSCDGKATKQSNGPTGCYEAPMTCKLSGSTCIATGSPAGCNGAFTSYDTASCGEEWYYSTKGCTRACSGSSCWCTAWFTGGVGGTQACN